ncbi:MAG: amidohydrolase family protein, partial [Bacteroidota bacterium]
MFFILVCFLLFRCDLDRNGDKPSLKADVIFCNGMIYTADQQSPKVEAVGISGDSIVFVGSKAEMSLYADAATKMIDLDGKTMIPGFIESHAHLMGIGYNLLNVDLLYTKSYQEVIDLVKERAANTPKGEWILGRGWHQDKWNADPERTYRNLPTHHELSEAVPDHPVFLKHASGHMALANEKAMEMAAITRETDQPDGGEIFMGIDGPTGIFNETAQSSINKIVPDDTEERAAQALRLAIEECLKNGITSFHDAGSGRIIDLFKQFGAEDRLKIRLYVMLRGDLGLMNEYFAAGPDIGLYNDHLTIRSVKMAADGALG